MKLGYHRSPIYSSYKSSVIANRPNIIKPNPPLSSFPNYKALPLSHVENISSDEAQLVDSENEFSSIFDNGKSYRTHRTSKKEKRQSRRKMRLVDGEKERCLAHGKRRCTDADCYPLIEVLMARKKRARHKYDDRKVVKGKYSSDSENELLRNREELKMALNIIEPSNRTINSSTLQHKLQNQQALEDDKKSISKRKKRKNSKSPERDLENRKRLRPLHESMKRSKIERDRSVKAKVISSNENQDNNNDNDDQEDDEEAISLEEQELRLIALKSAVLKKHEARKKKLLANQQIIEQIIRPYSPTDSVVLVADETGERSNDCIDSDNNNMDISPISSPSNQYQPMDMELASSNENSKSPIFSYEKPQTFAPFEQFIDWGTVHIPVPINAAYVELDQTGAAALSQSFALQPSYPTMVFETIQKEAPVAAENLIASPLQSYVAGSEFNDNEDELRAQLIEQMRSTNTSSSNSAPESSKPADAVEKIVPKENASNVDSLEEDCLRSLLLSSKGKKSNILKESGNEPQMAVAPPSKPDKSSESSDNAKCDDMPKLALNLREALKRLKNNQQNKMAAAESKKPTIKSGNVEQPNEKSEKVEKGEKSKSLVDCDQTEIQKTVVNNCLDTNKNELCNSEKAMISAAPSKQPEEKPITTAAAVTSSMPDASVIKGTVPIGPKATVVVPKINSVDQKVNANEPNKVKLNEVASSAAATSKPALAKTVAVKPLITVATKPIVNQTAVSKPKPNVTTNDPESVVLPPKPQSLTPPAVVKPNVTTTIASTANKMNAIRKSTASPIITTWTLKPVKKLIISLNEDSSSENDDSDNDTKSTHSSTKKTDTDANSQPNDSSNIFQLRLDQFLQTVRANTDATKQPVTTKPPTTPKSKDEKNSNIAVQKPQVILLSVIWLNFNKVLRYFVFFFKVSPKAESSKAVAHLPMSSQLEYHRLLNRMKQLEKQKEQKSRLKQQQQTGTTVTKIVPIKSDANFPSLTVVVQNENRFIQTKGSDVVGDKKIGDSIKIANGNKTNPSQTSKTVLPASNTSLAKRVLMKNAMDSLVSSKVTSELTQASDRKGSAATDAATVPPHVLPSVQGEQPSSSASEENPTTDTKSTTTMTLATLVKKTPKVKATVLANYVKRYRNHGFVSLSFIVIG